MNVTANEIPSKAKGAVAPPLAAVTGAPKRVLRVWVVDDNAALSELLAQLLTKQPGMRCTRKFPSAEAVLSTLAEERPPDVILLDVNLAGQSGLAAIRPIRKLAPTVKVLMMTMFSNGHYEAEAFRAGASGFLLKSYELAEIVSLIRAAYYEPDARALFPNLALSKEFDLRLNAASRRKGPLDLVRALRRLYGAARSQPAS